ncbi:hypothetical protein [Candidatus Methanarcanum hacksteinii]|uniref:hypothetical protein n=1 Tax=Candidatus Methanarcanum hacksteinii TaxID=2911857 RepID=UPI0037DD9F0A
MTISDFYLDSLKALYIRCCDEAGMEPGSFLKKTISSKKNKIYSAVVNSKYEAGACDPLAAALLEEGYIRPIDNSEHQYSITAKGMWIIEKEYYSQNIDDIINELDDRFFCSEPEKITDKNKIILFATIAVHAFSEKDGINPSAEKTFLNMMRDSFEVLHSLKKIDIPSFESIFDTKNTQKKKAGILTSTIDTLPRSTYSLFVSKKNCYYVNLIDNQTINKTGLKTLLKLIFDNISVNDIGTIIDGCKNISLNYSCYYHEDDTISNSDYNNAIELTLTELAGL